MSDLAAQRQINRGYDDGLARAIEFVLTPLVLGAIGFGLDGWLGTRPLFTIGLGVLGVVGIFVKMWLGYDREMRSHEAEGAWRRSPAERERPQRGPGRHHRRAVGRAPPSARAEAEPALARPATSAPSPPACVLPQPGDHPHGVVPAPGRTP